MVGLGGIHKYIFEWGGMPIDVVRVVDPQIAATFASTSIDLEYLSVSYMVNAEDFFRACPTASHEGD
ncbi:hypothetical protein F4809DRAFT_640310 [Biscogniauxia mediterranea]|nr:hypothetical protein F4809DRAFT_640310 [Biscogniauxia mediterranea]